MKRTMVLMSLGLFLMSFFIINHMYFALFLMAIVVALTQNKYRSLMVIFLLLALINNFYQCQKVEKYIYSDEKLEVVSLSSYKNDYVLKSKEGYKLLLKNDLNKALEIGLYHVNYEKNEYFYRNPHTFNYQDYLLSMGFVDVANLSEVDLMLIKKKTNLNSLKQVIYKAINKRIDTYVDDPLTKGFVKGLLLGDKSQIPEAVLTSFMGNGTSHILAISGMHIGMFYVMFQWPFIWLKSNKQYVALGLVFVFLWLIAWPYSGIRALCLMLGFLLSRYVKRPYDLLQTLSLIALILMLLNPFIIYHAGFQYSFCALIVISAVYQPIFFKVKNKFLSLLALSLTLQIGLIPLTVYHQLQLHVLSFFINILIVPLMTLVVYVSVFAVMLPLSITFKYLDLLVEMAIKINEGFGNMTFLKVELTPWPLWLIVFFYFFLMVYDDKIYRMKVMLIGLILLLGHMMYTSLAVEVYFLDIGQGDSILIKHQHKVTLIDSGPYTENNLLLEILKKNRIKEVDNIFISHGHADHMGGFSGLSPLTERANWYYKSGNEKVEFFEELNMYRAFNTDDYELIKLKGMMVTVVPYKSREALNDASMVMKLQAYHLSFLFTGDIEATVEKELINKLTAVDVLKVPHHGSNTSSTEEFVNKLKPEWAIVCVGKNFYKHPHEEVIDRYNRKEVKVRLTRNGYIKFVILPFNIHFVSP